MSLTPTIVIVSILGFFIVLTLLCVFWHWRKSRVRFSKRQSYNSYRTPPVRRLTIQGGRVVDVSNALEKAGIDDEAFVDTPYPTLHAFVEEPPPAEPRALGPQIRSNRAKIEIHPPFPEPPRTPRTPRTPKTPENAQRVSAMQVHDVHSLAFPSSLLSERSGSITLPRPSLINIEKKGSIHSSKAGKDRRETYPQQQESRGVQDARIRPHSDKPRSGREAVEVPESPLRLGIAHIFPSSGRTSEDNPSPREPPTPPPPIPPLPVPQTKSNSSSRTSSKHVQRPPPIPPNPRTSSMSSKKTPPVVPSPRRSGQSVHRPPPLDLSATRRSSQSYDKFPTLEPSPRKSTLSTNKRPQPSPRRSARSSYKPSPIEPPPKATLPPKPRQTPHEQGLRPASQFIAPPPPKPVPRSTPAQRPLTLDLTQKPSSTPAQRPLTLNLESKTRFSDIKPPAPLAIRSKPVSPVSQRPTNPLDLNPDGTTRVRFAPTWEASRQSYLSMSDSPISSLSSSVEPTSPVVRAPPPSTTELPQYQTPPPPTPGEIEAELEPEMVARLDRPPSLDVDIPHTGTFSSFFGSSSASDHQPSDLHRGPSVLSNRSGITIASSEISSNWTIGNAQLVNIYPSVGESSSSQPQEDRQTPPYAKTLRSKFGRYPRGRRDKALPGLPKSPLSMSFGLDYDDHERDQDQPGQAR